MLHLVGYRSESQKPAQEAVDKFLASHEVLGGDPGDPDPDPVKLDGWEPYTSPDNVFKASFPGATKKKTNLFFDSAKAAEFREYVANDEKSGKSRTYFAGYVRFAKKPTPKESRDVKEFVQRDALEHTYNPVSYTHLTLPTTE